MDGMVGWIGSIHHVGKINKHKKKVVVCHAHAITMRRKGRKGHGIALDWIGMRGPAHTKHERIRKTLLF